MNQAIASAAAGPLSQASGIAAIVRTWWARFMAGNRAAGWSIGPSPHRSDSLDDLNLRALRDIGAGAWRVERDMQRDRAEMQWRIDSQMRG